MAIGHTQRLSNLWNWLVAFRVVAETEHLPTAGKALAIAPSALSRTIRLLEADVGQPLFDRVGRSLVLNDAGHEMLRAVRFAMRRVDEALVRIGPGRYVGQVFVSAAGPFASIYIMPALDVLRAEHPELRVRLCSLVGARVNEELRRGEIDLAVLDDPIPDDDLTLVRLTDVPHGVFCGEGHPLWEHRHPSRDELLAHTFVTPPTLADGVIPDQWPVDIERKIGLMVSQMQVGVDACARGSHLAVLPTSVAEEAGLRAVAGPPITGTTLYAQHRPSLEVEGRTELLLETIEAAVANPPAARNRP